MESTSQTEETQSAATQSAHILASTSSNEKKTENVDNSVENLTEAVQQSLQLSSKSSSESSPRNTDRNHTYILQKTNQRGSSGRLNHWKREDRKHKKSGSASKQRNTESFTPSHDRADMKIIMGASAETYGRRYAHF